MRVKIDLKDKDKCTDCPLLHHWVGIYSEKNWCPLYDLYVEGVNWLRPQRCKDANGL
jgi:hypothetical protein